MPQQIDIDVLKSILRDHLDTQKQADILKEINQTLEEEAEQKEKESEEKPPKIAKKQIVIISACPPELKGRMDEIAGFITEIPEEQPTHDTKARIQSIREDYKSCRKAKKNPARTLGDLCELAPTKLFKAEGILKKPKPVEFTFVDNQG